MGQVAQTARHLVEQPVSRRYDFIFAGGGLAGLSLAYHLSRSEFQQSSVLIVDPARKDQNDRTWCFWTNAPTLFDEIVYRSWSQLQIKNDHFEKTIDLRDYRYQMIRGLDFYRFVREQLSARGNVEFVHDKVERVEDDDDGARVSIGNHIYHGKWVFDSRFDLSEFKPDPSRGYYLQQHFKGWLIATPQATFAPRRATLFDFRTRQKNGLRFFYVLPLSEHQALVEYVSLNRDDCDRELEEYVEHTLGVRDYRVVAREGGVNPLTDFPFPRRVARRGMTIGTPGGRIKPTSGYAFTRIQQDSAAIVDSLRRRGHPFDVPRDSRYFRLCDSLMLQLMYRRGDQMKSTFTALFENNPIERVFRFLDETTSPQENLALMASLPPGRFLDALARKMLRVPRFSVPTNAGKLGGI